MKHLFVVFFISFFCFSQNWKYDEAGNAFDGKYKEASVTGKGTDVPYHQPLLVIRKFDEQEYPDFFLYGAGTFDYYDKPTVSFNFDNEDEIYVSNYHSVSVSDPNTIFFEDFNNISFYDIIQKIKNGNKLYIRVVTPPWDRKNDLEFSLSGSSKAINFVIDKDLFDKIKQESDHIKLIDGCKDTSACNYDADATVDDGSCDYDSCVGCTDTSACNYNPNAWISNILLCVYAEQYYDCDGNCLIDFDKDGICDEYDGSIPLPFPDVAISPIFPGCKRSKKSTSSERKEEDTRCLNKGIMEHIKKNFEYPRIAKEMGVQEKIFVRFIIDKTGAIKNVKILRGEDKLLIEEAIRLVESLPKMTPGNHRGKPVSIEYILPINFFL